MGGVTLIYLTFTYIRCKLTFLLSARRSSTCTLLIHLPSEVPRVARVFEANTQPICAADLLKYHPVSYTHLDVYKRQVFNVTNLLKSLKYVEGATNNPQDFVYEKAYR